MSDFEPFIPPYPKPVDKFSLIGRLLSGWKSCLHILSERSYSMYMGEVWLPKIKVYIVNQRELVKRVLKTDAEIFPKIRAQHEVLLPLLGDSIFTTNGAQWKRQREMMNPAFTHTRLQKVFPLMQGAIDEMLARMDALDTSTPFCIDEEMTHVAADVIFRTILSHPINQQDAQEIYAAFKSFQDDAQKIIILRGYGIPSGFWRRRSERSAAKIRGKLAPLIKARHDAMRAKGSTGHEDILETLMQAQDPNTGEPFGYEELVDHVSMLFLAGHETSATALTWALYLIASCPHTQAKLQEEVDSVLRDSAIDFEDVRKLTFTKHIFQEALRLYPPVAFFTRESTEPVCMRNKNIKEGDLVVISPWLIQRHRKQWDQPDAFCPARFADPAAKESISESYFPFGGGPRICIGAGFATQEAVMVLALLAKRYHFSVPKGHVPEPVARVTLRPKNGVMLNLLRR